MLLLGQSDTSQPHMKHWSQLLNTLYSLGGVCPCPTVLSAAGGAPLPGAGDLSPNPGWRPVLLRLTCPQPTSAAGANSGGGAG